MATVVTRREKVFVSGKEHRAHLTQTGLLMEGDFTHLIPQLRQRYKCWSLENVEYKELTASVA
jgi:hypothetical protein